MKLFLTFLCCSSFVYAGNITLPFSSYDELDKQTDKLVLTVPIIPIVQGQNIAKKSTGRIRIDAVRVHASGLRKK